jgi:hypothetical protein
MSKENFYFKCVTDTAGVYIIEDKDIIKMTPVISRDNKPYIRIEFEDDEFKITNSIYCSEVKPYLTPVIP